MLSIEELQIRAALFRAIRKFFHGQQFLEADTPVRQPVIIPESNIQPILSEDAYLQTSPELYMKRLLASGCEKIFQVCHCFRKEERGRHHLEEFIMLEWYRKNADYSVLMEDCENLFVFLQQEMAGTLSSKDNQGRLALFSDPSFSLTPPWQRITVEEAFRIWSPVSLERTLEDTLFDEILVEYIEPKLGTSKPAFLYDYPVSMASLARRKKGNDDYSERFELYIRGVELGNGFSELTDPTEQRSRFTAEIEACGLAFNHEMAMPEKFLQELGKIGEAAGIAFGFDRLLMLLLGKASVDEAVTFSPDDF